MTVSPFVNRIVEAALFACRLWKRLGTLNNILRSNDCGLNDMIRSATYFFSRLVLLSVIIASSAQARDTALRDRVAGEYLLQGVMETASGFRLSNDGTYKFFLIYGSVDEYDVGKWEIEGGSVVLHSTASSADPEIRLVRSSRVSFPGAIVSFEGDNSLMALFSTDVVLHSNGKSVRSNAIHENHRQWKDVAAPIQKISVSLLGALRTYRTFEFEPRSRSHNNFVFQAILGNYGFVRFNGTQLVIGRDELILKMPDIPTLFRYVRVKDKTQSGNHAPLTIRSTSRPAVAGRFACGAALFFGSKL